MIAKVKVKCGNPNCSSMLAVVHGLADDGIHRVEYWDAIDADWSMADWSQAFTDAMTELAETGQSWGDLVAVGRRPWFDHWQVRCRDCGRVVAGHLPDLVAILRQAFSENTRKVFLTKDSIAKVRADLGNLSASVED